LSELKWFDGYSGQNTDQLLALEGNYRTDSIISAFEEGLDKKAGRLGKTRLTDEEVVILAIEALEREVNHGGFSAFFTNSSKEYAPVILNALTRIGCPEVFQLTRAALELLGIRHLISIAAIERAMEKDLEERDEKLNRLDEQYYDLRVDLSAPLLEFIKANRHKIAL
jgi:hypothetical protein